MQELLYRLGREQDRKFGLQSECTSQYHVEPYSLAVLQPIVFPDEKANPTNGIWNFRYRLHRCGDSKIYNAMFFASGNGETPPAPRAYYPGSTNAGPILVNDAMPSARMSAWVKAGLKDCNNSDVLDMQVTKTAHDLADNGQEFKGVWTEKWTFRTCEKTVDVDISFIPSTTGQGTTYVITTAE